MIVGTAGHIDHGKTTLVRALTGVDTDRLPEEKRRGISIELGFAYLDGPDGPDGSHGERIGFVDVPGHERLVHTMLAGATGIDHGLLVVAADDGVMPQTREHLAVLSLLGLEDGLVVITKADRVDAARIAAVRDEVAALVAGTTLATAPVFVVSAPQRDGIDAVLAHLAAAATRARPDDAGRGFRLAIDRAFTLDGVGVVVTGTAHAGRIAIGDRLLHLPGGSDVRVRSVHAQNRKVESAAAGQRVALGLVGVDREALQRGDWLAAPAIAATTARLDARLRLWPHEARDLKAGTRVQVHLGAAVVTASVAPLDVERLAPGGEGLVQLVLQRPIGAWRGDRVVLRDGSATRTIAGGQVIDPAAPARYRRTPQRLAELAALQADGPLRRRQQLLAVTPFGVDLARFAVAEGRPLDDPAWSPLAPAEALVTEGWALGRVHVDAARSRIVSTLADFHRQHPDELGPDGGRLRRLALARMPDSGWRALLSALVAEGAVSLSGAWVHLPEHGERLSEADRRTAEAIAPRLQTAGHEGAWVRDLAKETGIGEPLMRVTLARLARRGELHQVVRDLYYPQATIAALGRLCRELAARPLDEAAADTTNATEPAAGTITAARFRDATGLGRKRAIQLLEYFDRIGLLRRHGDLHRLRSDSHLFEQKGPAQR